MRVFMDGWQLQCCGEPFEVGSRVSWALRDPDRHWLGDVLGEDVAGRLDGAEEHHGGIRLETERTVGTVRSIKAVFYAVDEQSRGPMPGSGILMPRESAVKWLDEPDGLHFAGYLVSLAHELGPTVPVPQE